MPLNLVQGLVVYIVIPLLIPPERNWVYFALCFVLMPTFVPGLGLIAVWIAALAQKVTLPRPPVKVGLTVTFVMVQLQLLLMGFVSGAGPAHHVPTLAQHIYGTIYMTCMLGWWVLVPVSIVFVYFVNKYLR